MAQDPFNPNPPAPNPEPGQPQPNPPAFNPVPSQPIFDPIPSQPTFHPEPSPPSPYPPAYNPAQGQPQPFPPAYNPAPGQSQPFPPVYNPAPGQPAFNPEPGQSQPYPGYPSMPYGFPAQASQPYPFATPPSGAYPPGSQPWPMAPDGQSVLAPTTSGPNALARALPWWSLLIWPVGAAALLVGLALTGIDWPNDGMRFAIGAGSIGLLLLIILGTRLLAGMGKSANPQGRKQLTGALAAILVFAALGGAGLFLQSPLRGWQDAALEKSQQWNQALALYTRIGEAAPNGADLAHIYNNWGEALNKGQQYEMAIAKFAYVMTNFTGVQKEVNRAQSDTVVAYLAWGNQALGQKDFTNAILHLDTLLALSYCDTTCQSMGYALDATAYYGAAEGYLAAQNYASAVSDFQTLLTRFPSSPEAKLIHADYAKALYGAALAAINLGNCGQALSYDQQLVAMFKDTPQAKQAAIDLKAPQPVKGSFQTFSYYPGGYVALVQGLTMNDFSNNNVVSLVNKGVIAQVHADGTFQTKAVPQGIYDLIWFVAYSDGTVSIIGYFSVQTNLPSYIATVGPLCPFDFGTITAPFLPPGFAAPHGVSPLLVLHTDFAGVSWTMGLPTRQR